MNTHHYHIQNKLRQGGHHIQYDGVSYHKNTLDHHNHDRSTRRNLIP